MKTLVVSNTAWYLHNFRLPFMRELMQRGVEVVAVAPRDEWVPRLVDAGFRFLELPVPRRGMNPFTDFHMFLRLYQIYRRERPDVVFHNTVKPVIYGSLAARASGVGAVFDMVSGLGYVFTGNTVRHGLLRPLVTRLYRVALRKATKVFFQNVDDRDEFLRLGLLEAEKAVVTSGSGVDLERFRLAAPPAERAFCVVLMSARLLWDKGIGEFVEAARIVRKELPETRFQIVGRLDDGNPTGVDRSLVQEWVREGVIDYLGEVADVRPVLATADIAVLPSYREGTPRSILEAMAMSKPVVTTDAPGCRQTVAPGVNGLLVPIRDAPALARAIRTLVVDPQLRERMGAEGRRRAEALYDVRRVNRSILEAMGIRSPA